MRLAAGLGLVVLAAGCGGGGAPAPRTGPLTAPAGGVLRVAVEARTVAVDPAFAITPAERRLHFVTCTPLLTFPDEEGEAGKALVPGLAQELPLATADGRTVTVVLRDGVSFADGTPVTGEDVRRTFERLLDPALASPGAALYETIEGTRAFRAGRAGRLSGIQVSGREIRFRLSRSDTAFPARLALPFACPVKAGTPARPLDARAAGAMATGPYRVARSGARRLVLARNPAYAADVLGARGVVDRIDVALGVPREQAFEDAVADRIDVPLDGLPRRPESELFPPGAARRFVLPSVVPTGDVRVLRLDAARAPFHNVRVRQAIDVALDRNALATFGGGPLWASPSGDYLTPAVPGYTGPRRLSMTGDIAAARRLLEASGLPLPVTATLAATAPADRRVAEAIVRQLTPAGLRVRVVDGPGAPSAGARLAWARPRLVDAGNALAAVVGRSSAVPRTTGMSRALRAAARASGEARTLAYDRVAPRLADRYAPVIALWHANFPTVTSSRITRVGSHAVMQIDLAAVVAGRS